VTADNPKRARSSNVAGFVFLRRRVAGNPRLFLALRIPRHCGRDGETCARVLTRLPSMTFSPILRLFGASLSPLWVGMAKLGSFAYGRGESREQRRRRFLPSPSSYAYKRRRGISASPMGVSAFVLCASTFLSESLERVVGHPIPALRGVRCGRIADEITYTRMRLKSTFSCVRRWKTAGLSGTQSRIIPHNPTCRQAFHFRLFQLISA